MAEVEDVEGEGEVSSRGKAGASLSSCAPPSRSQSSPEITLA